MNYVSFQAVLWIAAGFLLMVWVIRRRKRRQAGGGAVSGASDAPE
jgi:hypothetical protein